MQCGIACLQMVCRYFGISYSIQELSHLCFATTEGVSLLAISEAAGKIGMRTIKAKVTIQQLINAPLPCILYWEQKHFVVLYRINRKKKYFIADPAKGLIKYTENEFKENWFNTFAKN